MVWTFERPSIYGAHSTAAVANEGSESVQIDTECSVRRGIQHCRAIGVGSRRLHRIPWKRTCVPGNVAARTFRTVNTGLHRICVEHGCWKRGAYRTLFLRGTSHPSSLGGDVHFRAWRHIVEDTNLGFGVLKASANGNT
jgi:hypothetical protein